MTKAIGRREEVIFPDLLFSSLKSFSQQAENEVFPRGKLVFLTFLKKLKLEFELHSDEHPNCAKAFMAQSLLFFRMGLHMAFCSVSKVKLWVNSSGGKINALNHAIVKQF